MYRVVTQAPGPVTAGGPPIVSTHLAGTREVVQNDYAVERRAMAVKSSAQAAVHKHDELARQVADSDTFGSAPTMRALLLYLWEHQGEPISEYAIATEALGRNGDFDPKVDSTARVQV